MKRLILLSNICLLLVLNVKGQFIERHWEEGDLKWDEFSQVDTSDIESASYFTYYLDYYLGYEKRKDTTFFFFKAENFTDKNALKVVDQFTDSVFLEYHQVLFDISELARRRLQNSFFTNSKIQINGNTLLDQAYDEAEANVVEMNEDTDFGLEAVRLKEWRDSINNLINKTENSYIPSYSLNKNSFGVHAGLGGSIHSGSLQENVKPSILINAGINAHFKNLYTNLNFNIGFGEAKKDTEGEFIWKKGDEVRQYNIMANVGYTLSLGRLQFIPYIGGGISGYQYYFYDEPIDEAFTEGGVSLAPQVGMLIDFLFYKKASFNRPYHMYYNTTPDTAVESHGIRLNFSFSPVSFNTLLKASGNIYQISANYLFHTRNITIKK